jgi:hypothetical protein
MKCLNSYHFCKCSKTTPRSGALASISSQNSTVTEDSKDFAGDGKDKATSSHDEHLQSAREAEAIGHDDEAILNYILGGNHKKVFHFSILRKLLLITSCSDLSIFFITGRRNWIESIE